MTSPAPWGLSSASAAISGRSWSVPRDALYAAYQAWCRSEGMLHVSSRGRLRP